MKTNFARLAGIAGLVAVSGSAQAFYCDAAYLQQYPDYTAYCPAAAPAVSKESIQATMGTHMLAISEAIRLISFGNPAERRLAAAPDAVTGMAAGDALKGLNIWTNLSRAQIAVDYQPLDSSGHVNNEIVGVDYRVSRSVVVGASVAFDQTRVDLDYAGGKLRGTGRSFAPYVAVQIDKNWSADFSAGVGDANQRMSAPGVAVSVDVDRVFYAANLNYERWMGDWQMAAKASYLDSQEEKLGLKAKLRQLRAGGQVGYWANGVMPYVSLAYSTDLHRPDQATINGVKPENDETTWVLGVGVNFFTRGAWSGGLSYTSELDRKESKQNLFMANVGYRF